MGFVTDAVYAGAGSDLELTTAWSITAGVEHNWNPAWRTSLYGGYEKSRTIRMPPRRSARVWHQVVPVHSTSAGGFTPTNCNPDFSFWQSAAAPSGRRLRVWSWDWTFSTTTSIRRFEGPVTVSANGTYPGRTRSMHAIRTCCPACSEFSEASCRKIAAPLSSSTRSRPRREFLTIFSRRGLPFTEPRRMTRMRT